MAYFVLAVLALAAGGVIGFLCGRMECLHSLLNGKTVTFAGETYAVREVRRNQESTDTCPEDAPHRETFRERISREYPEKVFEEACGGVFLCPSDYGYEERSECPYKNDPRSAETRCRECWDREIPEEKPLYWADGEEE